MASAVLIHPIIMDSSDNDRSRIYHNPSHEDVVGTVIWGMSVIRRGTIDVLGVALSLVNTASNRIYTAARLFARSIKTIPGRACIAGNMGLCIGKVGSGFILDELRGLSWHLFHPLYSVQGILRFISRDPCRQVRLLRACGMPIDPCTMGIFELQSDLDMCSNLWPVLMKEGADPAKAADKDMDNLRGKILILLMASALDGGETLAQKMVSLLSRLAGKTIQRTVTRTYKEVVNVSG